MNSSKTVLLSLMLLPLFSLDAAVSVKYPKDLLDHTVSNGKTIYVRQGDEFKFEIEVGPHDSFFQIFPHYGSAYASKFGPKYNKQMLDLVKSEWKVRTDKPSNGHLTVTFGALENLGSTKLSLLPDDSVWVNVVIYSRWP